MKKTIVMSLAAMMLITAGNSVSAEDIAVSETGRYMENVYPDGLLQLMYGSLDYETAKKQPYHYVGNVSVNLNVSGIEEGLVIYKLENGDTDYRRIVDGACSVSLPTSEEEENDNGKLYPKYKGTICGVVSLKALEESGVSVELGESQFHVSEYDENYTEMITPVKEADNKPFWLFYRRESDGDYGDYVRDELFYENNYEIYDGVFGDEKQEDIHYEIVGAIGFREFDGKYETAIEDPIKKMEYGYEYDVRPITISFDKPLTGILLVKEELDDSNGYCKAVPIANDTSVTFDGVSYMTENVSYKVIGFAPADTELDLSFEGTQDKTWEEYFVEWQEGTPEEVFDRYAAYYTEISSKSIDADEEVQEEEVQEEEVQSEEEQNEEGADKTVYTDAETIKKVQEALNAAGYDCGEPDGMAGSKTYAGMNAYQEANGLNITNDITGDLLNALGI